MEISQTLNTILTLIGGVSWSIVYILVIFRSFRDKTYGMPFWALAFNIAWEFIFSFVLVPATPGLQGTINQVWFALDVVLVLTYVLYGRKEWPPRISKKLFYPYSILVLLVGYLFVYLLSVELDHSQGMYAAFIQNLMMSVLFINMLNNRKSREGQSIGIAFFKMIGTLAPTIIFGMKSPFVLFLGSSCFVFDLIYLIMLTKVPKKSMMRTNDSITPHSSRI